MKKYVFLSFAVIANLSFAQIATRIDQYYQDFSLVNPAAINANNNSQINLFYNKLFTGVKGSPTNLLASAIFPNPEKRVGFGINLAQEKVGFSTLNNAYVTYAYTFPVSKKSKLHLGASLGFLSQRFNPNAIDVVNEDDPYYLSLQEGKSANRLDIKASAAFQTSGLLFGISSGRVTKPRFDYDYYNFNAQYSLQNLTTAFVSSKLKTSEDISLQPVASLTLFDFDRMLLQFGMNMYVRDKVWAGLHSAGNKNVSLQVGGIIGTMIKVGYSYSMPYSAESKLLGSGHEFYTSIILGKTETLVTDVGADELAFETEEEEKDNGKRGKKRSKKAEEVTVEEEVEIAKTEKVVVSPNVISVETIKMKSDTLMIKGFDDIKFLKSGYDTAKLVFADLKKEYPANGYYVTVGVFKNEANANRHIKTMYMKGLTSYKFFMPDNQHYYVYIFRGDTSEEADAVKWQEQLEIPDIWTKKVFKR